MNCIITQPGTFDRVKYVFFVILLPSGNETERKKNCNLNDSHTHIMSSIEQNRYINTNDTLQSDDI